MSYRNVIYNNREGVINLFTWNEEGERVMITTSFEPYLYIESPRGDKKSIYGTKLEKRKFNNSYNRSKFIQDSGIKRVFENVPVNQQFLLDAFWQENENANFSNHPIKFCFLDIETYDPPLHSPNKKVKIKKGIEQTVKVGDLSNYEDGYEIWDEDLNLWVDVKNCQYRQNLRKYNDFPNPENPYHTVNVITCYDNFSDKFHTFALKPYEGELADNIVYTYCEDERSLFKKFLEYLEADYPDVLSGWNSEGFDIPYIINRMERILGEEYVKRLSPVGNVFFRVIRGSFGQEKKRYYIDGIACIDYLDIYKRFCLKLRESYKLDAIGELELGQNKVDYGGVSLAALSEDDWEKFIDYNIQDVNLLVRLEEKLQYLSLLRMLSYVGLTTLEGAMGTIQVINGALCIRARKRGEIISTFIRSDSEGKNPGAYVAEPKSGFKNYIVSFDANSLYPNVMISLNTSPETKIGKVEIVDDKVNIQHVTGKHFSLDKPAFAKFIKEEECSLSKAGILFSQKKKGIIPEFLEYYYNQRVHIKKKLFKAKQKLKEDPTNIDLKYEVERLNTEQMVIKILVNSTYGYMGNKRAPIGDDDIASSVTLTGQAVIKQSNEFIKNYIRSKINDISEYELEQNIIYNDTDSSYVSIEPLIKAGIIEFWDGKDIHQQAYDEIDSLEKYLNENINSWARKALLTKDSRFVFKRECIGDVGLFLQKKRYVMHILDDEGIKEDKFKYTGVEVVRTTMPNSIKPYAKRIIETMLTTQSLAETNKVLEESYEIFKSLSPEDIAFVFGVKNYEKYASQCKDFTTVKGMPIHVKSAYYYNKMLNLLNTGSKYEDLASGDKVRYVYVEQPNKYGIKSIGFKYEWPEEFNDIFKPNYEKMFEKILFQAIERFYLNVNWTARKPSDNVRVELLDLFA